MSTLPPPVRLKRAQIRPNGVPGVDTTVKSGIDWAKAFAPTWSMVCGHKNWVARKQGEPLRFPTHGIMTGSEYQAEYEQILNRAGRAWRQLWELGRAQGGEVTVLCYCPDHAFCHTYQLIDFAVSKWPERFCKEVEVIRFNSKTPGYAWLSNFHECAIATPDGTIWGSAEHLYQAKKAGNPDDAARIHLADTPKKAKELGGKLKQIQPNWDETRLGVMREVLRLKFSQNPGLAEQLVATHPLALIHQAPWDSFWGDGRDGQGQNMQGKLLMELRDELYQA